MISWASCVSCVSWVSRVPSIMGYISNKIKHIFGVSAPPKLVVIGNSKTNRVAIVGDSGVGKSTFLNCLRKTPYDNPVQTIGYDLWIDKSELNPYTKALVFYWDVGIGRPMGSIEFGNGSFPNGNMASMNIFILVYDATWSGDVSREYIDRWLQILTRRPHTKTLIVGLRRPDQRNKPIIGYSGIDDMSHRVITSCVCDMATPCRCDAIVNVVKTLCKNECLENSFVS